MRVVNVMRKLLVYILVKNLMIFTMHVLAIRMGLREVCCYYYLFFTFDLNINNFIICTNNYIYIYILLGCFYFENSATDKGCFAKSNECSSFNANRSACLNEYNGVIGSITNFFVYIYLYIYYYYCYYYYYYYYYHFFIYFNFILIFIYLHLYIYIFV
jgi:hypothetical protein